MAVPRSAARLGRPSMSRVIRTDPGQRAHRCAALGAKGAWSLTHLLHQLSTLLLVHLRNLLDPKPANESIEFILTMLVTKRGGRIEQLLDGRDLDESGGLDHAIRALHDRMPAVGRLG